MRYLSFILLAVLCLPQAAGAAPYVIEISKGERSLLVKRDEQVVKQYRISHGRGGRGAKQQAGDNKTPIGAYNVVKFKADSKFHFFMQLNYPNSLDAWHGYGKNLISAAEFRQIVQANQRQVLPPQGTGLGGYIGIHGIGRTDERKRLIHQAHNWTEGCIAMKNEEVNELRRYVALGTRVVIRE